MVMAPLLLLFLTLNLVSSSYDGPLYDSTAYTECKSQPENALYGGGLLKDRHPVFEKDLLLFKLENLTQGYKYCFSIWIKMESATAASALVRASIVTEETSIDCIGTVIAKQGCWSFLKGGFVLSSPSNSSTLRIQNVDIAVAGASLQPFSDEQWRLNQEAKINEVRKRAVMIHVSNKHGVPLQNAEVRIEQVSREFPFGSAIAESIIGNAAYQKWFVERFNVAVFENELKWNATEFLQGEVNYTVADRMLEFVRANQIMARGHNIFWEDPKFVPRWVSKLSRAELESAVASRIDGLMSKYREQFIHWDVNNEMLHFDFYEDRLGSDATLRFFETAHRADPLATLFMNEFNVVETCSDGKSTVDTYVSRLRELKLGGVSMDGIGLQGHFGQPNPVLMRGILDKLATLRLPIWLTEVDISSRFGNETQAAYLEEVLREGFSHPGVDGIILWAARRRGRCYQMCLTDDEMGNLPAGVTVDRLLEEWGTGVVEGKTDEHGAFSFVGFLGEYKVEVKVKGGYGGGRVGDLISTAFLSLSRGRETRSFNVQL
ncbi:endo-1,4-beta-xylanase 4-like [Andrographis paniculata]|uniref:endo-1,4-beta-xylanase 4-like n=1 Tax=Andrographis paniculata TaxID=175694 RepID=UPI0021E8E249|nr:endo-1,4-beta-xylanase 4-like [Andrographis paniculata]